MSSGDSVASSESEPSESLLRILGMQGREKCGYCGTESGSRFFALRAHTLQCKDYQILVDRGLESAEFSEQKYRVFERYQETVHNDTETSRKGFRKFLCDSPLVPLGALGSFHQCYYVDGRLVAVGVVDVLP
ncbi:Arginyl-tRNA--protein transferase 1, partial [Linderina macrospora]